MEYHICLYNNTPMLRQTSRWTSVIQYSRVQYRWTSCAGYFGILIFACNFNPRKESYTPTTRLGLNICITFIVFGQLYYYSLYKDLIKCIAVYLYIYFL